MRKQRINTTDVSSPRKKRKISYDSEDEKFKDIKLESTESDSEKTESEDDNHHMRSCDSNNETHIKQESTAPDNEETESENHQDDLLDDMLTQKLTQLNQYMYMSSAAPFIQHQAFDLDVNINNDEKHMERTVHVDIDEELDITDQTDALNQKLKQLSEKFIYDNDIFIERTMDALNLDITFRTAKKSKSPRFGCLSQRTKNGFDLNNANHVHIARQQILKRRLNNLKKSDMQKFNDNTLNEFISVDEVMQKIEDNEKRNGNLLCDLCRNQMFLISEKHKNAPNEQMHISRFDHSTYHSTSNIKTLECGMCNQLRGKHNISVFLEQIDDILANDRKNKLKVLQFKINVLLLKMDLFGITTDSTQQILSKEAVVEHLKKIKQTQHTHPYFNVDYN
eukprot:5425_1